jgi:uncharacterized protein YecT (DUF1311 family)
MKNILILFAMMFVSAFLYSQEAAKKNPIDKWLDDCLETNQSTQGMVDCANEAYIKWDSELNKVYKKLLSLLDTDSQKKLKESQRAWVKFRDEEFKLLDSFYATKEGSMYLPMHALDKVDIVKNRVQELSGHLQVIKDM